MVRVRNESTSESRATNWFRFRVPPAQHPCALLSAPTNQEKSGNTLPTTHSTSSPDTPAPFHPAAKPKPLPPRSTRSPPPPTKSADPVSHLDPTKRYSPSTNLN